MRWYLGSFVKRLRERPGHRPARPAARPALGLERLEERRLLSTATALSPAALLDPNHTASTAVVGAATSGATAGGTASAPLAPLQVAQIADPNSPYLIWTVAGVYQFQVPYQAIQAGFSAVPSGQAASQNTTPPDGGTSSANTSSSAASTNESGSASGQTTTAAGQDSTATAQGDFTALSPQTTPNWVKKYFAIVFDRYILYLRVRALLAAPTPAPAPPGADAGGSSSAADATTTADSEKTVAPATDDATTTGDAAAPASLAPLQPASATLTVEISYAVDSAPSRTVGASTAANAGAANAVLSVVVTGPTPGQGIGVSVTVADETDGASTAGAPAVPAADSSPPAAQASDQAATSFSFSFQLLIALDQGGATGAAKSPSTPSAAPSLTGAGGSADHASAAPAASSGQAVAVASSSDTTTTAAGTAPALTAAVEMFVIDGPAPAVAAVKVAATAVAAWEASEWSVAAPTGSAVEAPPAGAEHWAALAGSLSEGLVAASVDPMAFFAAGVASAPQGNASVAPGSRLAGGQDERAGIGEYLCAGGGVVLSGLRLTNGLGSDGVAQSSLPIAEVVKESSESLTALVRGLYRSLLGRAAGGGEEQGWVAALLAGQTQEQFLEAFLSTAEFGQRADGLVASGTPDERYLGALHLALLQRPATAEELTAWLAALPELGREGVVACLVRSNEFRALAVQGFYLEVYGVSVSADDAAEWAASPMHLLAIREALATRPDLFAPTVEATSEPLP